MATAAGRDDKHKIEVKASGMRIHFKGPGVVETAITFTRVEEDTYKLTFEELLKNQRDEVTGRNDLLFRHTDPSYSGPIYTDQCIIVREDLHITEETAREIWEYLSRHTPFMNGGDGPVAEITTFSKVGVTAVIHYLERIAESLHAQKRREAVKASKASKAKGSKSKGSKGSKRSPSGSPKGTGSPKGMGGGSRKYKKSKRILRRKSRATRRR
jgi:hypothetical protein